MVIKMNNDDVETRTSYSRFQMLGKPRMLLDNLKTSLRVSCLDQNPIIDTISLIVLSEHLLWLFLVQVSPQILGVSNFCVLGHPDHDP